MELRAWVWIYKSTYREADQEVKFFLNTSGCEAEASDLIEGLVKSSVSAVCPVVGACAKSPDSRFLLALNALLILGIKAVTSW